MDENRDGREDSWPLPDEDEDEYAPGIPLSIDFLPRDEAEFRTRFLGPLNANAAELFARAQRVPDLTVRRGPYFSLLLEARHVFVLGHWYACVAMCGIAVERIIKDRLRSSVRIEGVGKVRSPSEQAFDQLERVDASALTRFVRECGTLSERGFKAAEDLGQLRNKYAHARGKSPEADALRAIELLHTVVEETVHVRLD